MLEENYITFFLLLLLLLFLILFKVIYVKIKVFKEYMRFFIFLIEILLPIITVGTISYVIYKYINIVSSKKKWLKDAVFHKNNRYDLSFSEILEDWAKFVYFSNENMPYEVIEGLKKITDSLQSIEIKAKTEHWFHDKLKLPHSFYPVADIIYKHFPDLISEYLEIPKKIADTKKNYQGKTATQLLIENSQILVNTVESKTQQLFEENINKMTSQQIHFKDKFDKEMEL